jgi:hypothetical protein
MRGKQETIALPDLLEHLIHHGGRPAASCDLQPFLPSFCAPEQFVDARRVLLRTINDKDELGSMPQPHAFCELMADESFGGIESVERLLGFLLISVHTDEDSGHFAAWGEHNFGDGNQADPGIAQFTLQNQIDFFPKSPYPPFALMLRSAWLNHKKLQ